MNKPSEFGMLIVSTIFRTVVMNFGPRLKTLGEELTSVDMTISLTMHELMTAMVIPIMIYINL